VSHITERLPKRKAKSLESFKFPKNITRIEVSGSDVKPSKLDKISVNVDKPDPGNCDNVPLFFPSSTENCLQPDHLFMSHKKASTVITPKSSGFEPSLEDWESLAAALQESERGELAHASGAVEDLADPLLESEVVTSVRVGEMTETGRGHTDGLDSPPGGQQSQNGFNGEEFPRDLIGSVDNFV
jgi:hypothetical protein